MSISKKQLDDYYNDHYDRLYSIIKGICNRNKKTITVETILSECYINMLTKLDKIKPDKIGHFITSFARLGTSFNNNKLSKEVFYHYTNIGFVNNFSHVVNENMSEEEYLLGLAIDYTTEDEDEEIFTEEYNKLLSKIESFKNTLNIVDKILCDYLLESLLNKRFKIEEVYIDEDKDTIKYYKKQLKKLKIRFIEYARNK